MDSAAVTKIGPTIATADLLAATITFIIIIIINYIYLL